MDYSSAVVAMAFMGGLAGLGLGLAQWLVLRRRMSGVWWWLLANAGAGALGLAVALSIAISMQGNDVFGYVIILTFGCALPSVAAGLLLPRLLKPAAK
jgi:hypothetical protein